MAISFKNISDEISSFIRGGIILFISYFLPAYALKNEVWWPFLILALLWGFFFWWIGRNTSKEKYSVHDAAEDAIKSLDKE